MPETPDDIYRQAADAMVGADESCDSAGRETRKAVARMHERDRRIRAAVDAAYAAGRASWLRDHPLPICDGGEIVLVTDLGAWMAADG